MGSAQNVQSALTVLRGQIEAVGSPLLAEEAVVEAAAEAPAVDLHWMTPPTTPLLQSWPPMLPAGAAGPLTHPEKEPQMVRLALVSDQPEKKNPRG